MLDMSFMTSVNDYEKYIVIPKRFDHLFRVRRVKVPFIVKNLRLDCLYIVFILQIARSSSFCLFDESPF